MHVSICLWLMHAHAAAQMTPSSPLWQSSFVCTYHATVSGMVVYQGMSVSVGALGALQHACSVHRALQQHVDCQCTCTAAPAVCAGRSWEKATPAALRAVMAQSTVQCA